MTSTLDKIISACEWVESKGKGSRDSCKVSTTVKWADWDKKYFSPAMCVLWYAEVKGKFDDYETFWIPDPETWTSKVAQFLDVSDDWVNMFVKQCHLSDSLREEWSVNITFNGSNNHSLINPIVTWKKIQREQILLPESSYCIEKFGNKDNKQLEIPYWTKNPPIDHYRSKLISAAYDLFCAKNALENNG